QLGFEAGAVVAECGQADAAIGRGDQCPAEPSRYGGEADPLAVAAAASRRRGHAKTVRRRFISSRAGAEPGAVHPLRDALARVDPVGETAEPMGLAPFARRRAGDLLEYAMEMA